MRTLRVALLTLAVLAGPAVLPAHAVTAKDLVALSKAGLSDDVLIALMDSDGTVFHLTAADIRELHDGGLSDSVLVAMLDTSHKGAPSAAKPVETVSEAPVDVPPPAPIAPAPFVQVINEFPAPVVIEQQSQPAPPPQTVPVFVYYPIYVARPIVTPGTVARPAQTGTVILPSLNRPWDALGGFQLRNLRPRGGGF